MRASTWVRTTVATTGALILLGTAGAAFADTADDVDIDVEIAPIVQPGELALSVAPGGVTLAESGTTAEWRQFTGELPTVTVTDTRQADQVQAGAFWYVVGTASDFVGTSGEAPIPASHLGWTPELLTESASGLVAEGDPVQTAMDSGPSAVGLVDQEFLVSTLDSGTVREEGSWSAGADLFLRTPLTVTPGQYRATLTLSLFE